jgi:hypothetical protein
MLVKYKEERPMRCLLYIGNLDLPLTECVWTTQDSVHSQRHFLRKHMNPPWHTGVRRYRSFALELVSDSQLFPNVSTLLD